MAEAGMIPRKSLHGELVAVLRDMILGGELKPGDKIPEAALCTRFGVSRTPLREATKVLAAEGLLQLLPNRGAMVAKITNAEIEELFPIMGALEGLAGEFACMKASEAEIAGIRKMHDEMVGCYERNEYASYAKLNRAIHEAFFTAARSPVLTGYFNNLIIRTHAIRFVARKSRERWREAVEDHEKMMAALEARDAPMLGELLREHLRHKIGMVSEAMAALATMQAAE
jgi:DNA-binding GntR family transcriptional regulator